ncbi:hypothetical protein D3C76_1857720 [compost metagenome]
MFQLGNCPVIFRIDVLHLHGGQDDRAGIGSHQNVIAQKRLGAKPVPLTGIVVGNRKVL